MNPELKYGLLRYLTNGKVPGNIDKLVQRLVMKVADHYIINKNHLIQVDSKKETLGGRQTLTYQTVINTNKRNALLKKVHDEPLGGHLGQDNTYQ